MDRKIIYIYHKYIYILCIYIFTFMLCILFNIYYIYIRYCNIVGLIYEII